MTESGPANISESDVTKLILQNRRLVTLLKAVNKQLIRGQHVRLHDAVAADLLRSQIDEELARSALPVASLETGAPQ